MPGIPPPAQAAKRTSPKAWAVLALLAAAGLLAGAWLRNQSPLGTDISETGAFATLLADDTAPSVGPTDADVTIVEFSDYQCPACRAAHPELLAAVAEDGRTRIVYRDWPVFGEQSQRAAQVALAAHAQGRYAAVHDHLMQERRAFTDQTLRMVAREAGADWNAILAARDGTEVERRLARTREDALRLGINATPTYVIGPYRIVGALSQAQFAAAIARARARR